MSCDATRPWKKRQHCCARCGHKNTIFVSATNVARVTQLIKKNWETCSPPLNVSSFYPGLGPWQNEDIIIIAATLLCAARTQNMFLTIFRNNFCVQDTNVASATNVTRVAKRLNILGNMIATARCLLVLPGP